MKTFAQIVITNKGDTKMKIAIATDDNQTVTGHVGRCNAFIFYTIEDGKIVCPIHGWMFDIKTGKMPMSKTGLDVYPVIIKGLSVYVKVHQRELNW